MPINGPQRLDESGQVQSGETLQAPGNSAMEVPASKKPLARLAKAVGGAAIGIVALAGCSTNQPTQPGTTPGTAPSATPGNTGAANPFQTSLEYCYRNREIQDPRRNLPPRQGGLRTFVKQPNANGTSDVYQVCSTPTPSGQTGMWLNHNDYECDANKNCKVFTTASRTGHLNANLPNSEKNYYDLRSTDRVASSVLDVFGNPTAGEGFIGGGRAVFVINGNVVPIPNNTEVFRAFLVERNTASASTPTPTPVTPVVVPTTPPRVVPTTPSVVAKNTRDIAGLKDDVAELRNAGENRDVALGRHEAQIGRNTIALTELEKRQAESRKILLGMKGTNDHDFTSFDKEMERNQ